MKSISMKSNTFLLFLIITMPLSAQVFTKPSNSGGSTSTQSKNSSSSNTNTQNTHQKNSTPYGQEIPVFDPSSETVTLFGQTYDIKDNRLGGQFEAYLSSDAYTDEGAKSYRDVMDEILDMISPNNPKGFNPYGAKALLPKASSYPGDGNICDSLASLIFSASNVHSRNHKKKNAIAELEKESKRISRNMDVMSSKSEATKVGNAKTGKDAKKAPGANSRVSSMEYLNYGKRLLEIEALKKKYEAQGNVSFAQSKFNYQAFMVQLFVQRRFEHVIIAARFYNHIYIDGDDKLRLDKKSDTSKFFTEGIGVNPTVTGLDSAANEAIRKVKTLVNAFENNLASGRTHSAAKRLTEAYAIGEFLPVVQTIPLSQKNRILDYVQKSNMLVQAISSKNFVEATRLNNELKSLASDFIQSAKVDAAIFTYTSGSNSYVQEAKFALLDKNMEAYKEALGNAIQMWPTNPKVRELQDRLDRKIDEGERSNDVIAIAKEDFDRMLSDENYRKISEPENYVRFTSTFGQTNDTERLEQLSEILESFKQIEKSIAAAAELEKEGQTYAAWERLFEAQQTYYDDRVLNQEMSRLSGEVANFTNTLTRARSLETRANNPQSGSALSYYLKARRIHPGSKLAKEGIERLVDLQFRGIETKPKVTRGKDTTDDDFENF